MRGEEEFFPKGSVWYCDQSVHLTQRYALAAINRSPPGHAVMIVDTEHACAYLTHAKEEEVRNER